MLLGILFQNPEVSIRIDQTQTATESQRGIAHCTDMFPFLLISVKRNDVFRMPHRCCAYLLVKHTYTEYSFNTSTDTMAMSNSSAETLITVAIAGNESTQKTISIASTSLCSICIEMFTFTNSKTECKH